MADMANVAILGASGYTGAELIRLLANHPRVRLSALTADRKAGQAMASVFPHLAAMDLPDLIALDAFDPASADFVFCALPHGTTQEIIAGLPRDLKVCDLSADFRLADLDAYATWYGHPHRAPDLQAEAVYGLTELAREAVAKARLVANPGCYPTTAQLPLIPLIEAGQIDLANIIIDSKSGVSGAGRAAKEGSLYCEVAEGMHAYGVASHRHGPEIEQGLSIAAGKPVVASFTPHLIPMNRGMLSTIYVNLAGGASAADLHATLAARYAGEPFVKVLPFGATPHTRHVRGSNLALIGVTADRRPGGVILTCAIDNLTKGASGQAVQNMNVMLGFAETLGLSQAPMFP
ncbi:MAG: N-acetyl-gamma-glutamyl-phosphate reductase [Rhodospirillaceae bacterium]